MRTILMTDDIREKLEGIHKVCEKEVEQCFDNLCGTCLEDNREDHKTDPTTYWFVSETNRGRVLKVAFMLIDSNIHIKTAYEANEDEIRIFDKYGR